MKGRAALLEVRGKVTPAVESITGSQGGQTAANVCATYENGIGSAYAAFSLVALDNGSSIVT